MGVVKVLERKSVIRFFGVALTLAPFFNILMSMSVQTNVPNPWTSRVFWLILKSSTVFDYFLYGSSLIIGLIMLRGSTSAWKFVLFLLGGCILNQTLNLGQNARANWMAWPFFIINVGTFLFILDQLVWKQKTPTPQRPKSTPLPARSPTLTSVALSPIQESKAVEPSATLPPKPAIKPIEVLQKHVVLPPTQTPKKILIHFEGLGPWAQLVGISKNGIQVRCLTAPPEQIETREIEISMKNGLHFKLRFAKQSGSDFYFDFKNLTSHQIQSMNQWLVQLAS